MKKRGCCWHAAPCHGESQAASTEQTHGPYRVTHLELPYFLKYVTTMTNVFGGFGKRGEAVDEAHLQELLTTKLTWSANCIAWNLNAARN